MREDYRVVGLWTPEVLIAGDCDSIVTNLNDSIFGVPVPARQRQAACSHPQPISITRDFSASLQYSLQYLLPSSGGQSHAGCAQVVLLVSSAMTIPPLPQVGLIQLSGMR